MIFIFYSQIWEKKKLPENPAKYHPVDLLYQMVPKTKFVTTIIQENFPTLYEVSCEISDTQFKGQGNTYIYNLFIAMKYI